MPDEPLGAAPDAVTVPVTDSSPVTTGGPPVEWQGGLYRRVINAIFALPNHFKSSLDIKGIRATDLYTLNTALGAAIEQSVVDNLNAIRTVWDPDGHFQSYAFVRQAQVFPDVRLQTDSPTISPQILMGIELKGWFALSKEGEPSFRYTVNPNACADADLLVVFPWMLDEILSGAPRLLRPFVTEARFAALHRNHYWQVTRGAQGLAVTLIAADHQSPYPSKANKFNDTVAVDSGGNFGRVARSGIMQDFISSMMTQPAAGIPLGAWQRFVKIFADGTSADAVQMRLQQVASSHAELISSSLEASEAFDQFVASLKRLLDLSAP